jgi:hypothetical protein
METNNTSTNEDLTIVINDLKKEITDIKKIINILMQNKNEEKNDKNVTYVVIKENQATHDMNQKMDILMQRLEGKQEITENYERKNEIKREENIKFIKDDTIEDNNQHKKEDVIKYTKKKTKTEKYQKERIDFIDELEKIMGLSESKRDILLCDLENNNELKKYLKNKISDIQKFYKCGSWNYFIKLNSNSEVSEIALLKSIFKSEKYDLFNKRVLKDINGVKKMYPIYTFYKNIKVK